MNRFNIKYIYIILIILLLNISFLYTEYIIKQTNILKQENQNLSEFNFNYKKSIDIHNNINKLIIYPQSFKTIEDKIIQFFSLNEEDFNLDIKEFLVQKTIENTNVIENNFLASFDKIDIKKINKLFEILKNENCIIEIKNIRTIKEKIEMNFSLFYLIKENNNEL